MRLRTRLPDFNSRKGAENPTDIESRACHQGEASSALSTEKLRYLGLVFNLPEDTIRKYHGVHAYCHYIESSFGPLLEDQYAPVWDVFGMPQPRSTPDCWLLPIAVLVSLKSRTKAATIDSVLDSLMSDHGTATLRNRAFPQIAVFAVLCWATMILTPSLQPGVQQPHLACKLPGRRDTDGAVQHKLHGCKRAISVALREFKSQAWGAHVMRVGQHDDEAKRAGQQNLEENEDLYEATLNYSSLQLFGKIRIQWVTTMTAHLDFDPASRCLSLYRFPSVCALKAAQGDESISPVFKSISEDFDPLRPDDTIHRYIRLEQEILLSYRLLFGQSAASRKIAQRQLALLRRDGSPVDDFLSTICMRKYRRGIMWWSKVDEHLDDLPPAAWPISCRDSEQRLQERDVYSAVEDFPRLGRRLMQLQKFNLRQRPSKLTDLWRDRRNALQWYTFWAVLIIGGMANLIAVLQLVVALYQTVPGPK